MYVSRTFATKFWDVVNVLISFLFSILELTLAKHGNRQYLEFLLLSVTLNGFRRRKQKLRNHAWVYVVVFSKCIWNASLWVQLGLVTWLAKVLSVDSCSPWSTAAPAHCCLTLGKQQSGSPPTAFIPSTIAKHADTVYICIFTCGYTRAFNFFFFLACFHFNMFNDLSLVRAYSPLK